MSVPFKREEIKFDRSDVKAIEVRHAVYCAPPNECPFDVHYMKQIVHLNDGRSFPRFAPWKDFQRPYWITKKGMRKHKEKKESEKMENLEKHMTTESRMAYSIQQKLGLYGNQYRTMRGLSASPYLYGTDITSTAIIKQMFADRYPDTNTPMTMAATDTETNMFSEEQEIIMQTISFKDRIFTAISRNFLRGHANVEEKLQALLLKYLEEDVKKRNIKWEIMQCDTPAEIVQAVLMKAHIWMPDFVAIWNIEFDMNKMLDALNRAKVDPADVFSDPTVPEHFRHFNFKLGPAKKTKSDGSELPLAPSERWHSVTTPASFTMIDAMCAYRHIRTGSQALPSYSLDYIMEKEVKRNKLKFAEADGYTDGAWHAFMQENYPLEYVIYNVFDCVGMEILDEKTQDLAIKLAMFSGSSDYAMFNSQPKRLCNDFHFFLLQEGQVLGSTGPEMKNEHDELTTSGKGWITMLQAHLVTDNGLKCVEEYENVPSNFRGHNGDLDVEGSYPNAGMCYNISKSTTKRELIQIQGVTEEMRRRQGVNLSGGYVNAVEIACGLFQLPTLDDMYASYLRDNPQ